MEEEKSGRFGARRRKIIFSVIVFGIISTLQITYVLYDPSKHIPNILNFVMPIILIIQDNPIIFFSSNTIIVSIVFFISSKRSAKKNNDELIYTLNQNNKKMITSFKSNGEKLDKITDILSEKNYD